ncbi:MAG: NAD(P)H-hydrate epimerase [Chloroflexota bacterium]|jgi:NAD(P)H-hydrate epimerase
MDLPALTTEQIVEVDRLMIEEYGILLIQMMENAGRSLAEMARRMLGGRLTERRVVVLCGRGNNGGGGMVAARHLHNRGATVSAKLIGDPTGLKEIPGHQWDILQMMALTQADDPDLGQVDLIVDAIIGYGLQGNPRGVAAEWIRRANEFGRPVLALDAPSGLDTTTGAVGEPCIKARATLTLALPKVGLLSPGAAGVVGQLYVADIGVPPELYGRLGLEVGPLFKDDVIVGLPRQQSPKPGSPSNSLRRS